MISVGPFGSLIQFVIFCQTGAVTKKTILSAVAVDVVAAIEDGRDVRST